MFVRFGSTSEVSARSRRVRFAPINGHHECDRVRRKMPTTDSYYDRKTKLHFFPIEAYSREYCSVFRRGFLPCQLDQKAFKPTCTQRTKTVAFDEACFC